MDPSSAGMKRPAWFMRDRSPAVLIAMVLPPALEPVMTRMRNVLPRVMDTYLNVHPDADFKLVAQTADASHVAIPVLKSEDPAYLDALNTAIEELRADGTLKTLSEKYFGQDISSEN